MGDDRDSHRAGLPVAEWFDPLSPEYLADPYTVLAALPGDGAPVFFAPSIGYYIVTRYAGTGQVFADPVPIPRRSPRPHWCR